MDYGYHPPTIYFPLVVPEALMIEPTETEPKERLDAFVEAMLAIAREAAETPELLKEAPTSRPVRRLDEVKAAKRAVVKYGFDEHPDLSAEAGRSGSSRHRRAREGGPGRPGAARRRARRAALGPAFADAIKALAADLNGDEEELLKEILLERGANFDKALMDRVDARGWFQRQWDKASDASGPRSGGDRGRGGEEP